MFFPCHFPLGKKNLVLTIWWYSKCTAIIRSSSGRSTGKKLRNSLGPTIPAEKEDWVYLGYKRPKYRADIGWDRMRHKSLLDNLGTSRTRGLRLKNEMSAGRYLSLLSTSCSLSFETSLRGGKSTRKMRMRVYMWDREFSIRYSTDRCQSF